MSLISDQADYYANLLASEYRVSEKNRQQIRMYVKQALGDMLATNLDACFNIDTAVGAQLDTLGKYIGVSRIVGDPIDRPYYNFSDSDGTVRPNGFQNSTNPSQNSQAIWYQSEFTGTQNTALSDLQYRLLLKMQIVLNANDGTLASVQDFLLAFLPGAVVLTDNADMSITYTLSARLPLSPTVLRAYLPKPMGVRVIFDFLTALVTPATLGLTVSSPSPHAFVGPTASVGLVITNGVGPYQYSWEFIGETNPGDLGHTIADTPNAATTTFERAFNAYGTAVSQWRCNVTDSLGIVCRSDIVTVTLTLTP